jgi:hypothetical protein
MPRAFDARHKPPPPIHIPAPPATAKTTTLTSFIPSTRPKRRRCVLCDRVRRVVTAWWPA